jgi:diguanylate cyclase (GGDEF)-like protein
MFIALQHEVLRRSTISALLFYRVAAGIRAVRRTAMANRTSTKGASRFFNTPLIKPSPGKNCRRSNSLNHQRLVDFRSLVWIAAGLMGMAVVAIGLTIWALYEDAVKDAEHNAGNIAAVLAEQTSRSVQSIDLVMAELRDRIRALGVSTPDQFRKVLATEEIHRLLRDRLSRLPRANLIGLADDTGRVVNNTSSWPPPRVNVADREFFQHAKNEGDRKLYVNTPVTNRSTGIRVIGFSRRIESADGTFLGIMQVAVQLDYFRHVYELISTLTDQSFLFLRRDGVVLICHPDPQSRTGDRMPVESPWYDVVAKGGGYFHTSGVFDGIPRVVAVRPLADYPLVVNVAMSETAALAVWQRRALLIGIGATLTLLGFTFLLRAFAVQFRQLTMSEKSVIEREARLSEKSGELELANVHFEAALNNMSQGLTMFDAQARLVVCNARYLSMYGLTAELVRPGASFAEVMSHRKAAGSFHGDTHEYVADMMARLAEGRTFTIIVHLDDGRVVSLRYHPMANGGWVATHDDVTERWQSEARITHMARHDPLTDLANRILFLEKMDEALERLRVSGEQFAVFIFDLDMFKAVNDSLGHPVGDLLLKEIANRLRALIGHTHTVGRLGGDEFAILQATNGDMQADAAALARRLTEVISVPYEIDGHRVEIGISVGIAMAPADGTESSLLLKNADLALYRAKMDGRNCHRFYHSEMDAQMRLRHSLEIDLRNALPRNEFELHYQTVIDLATNTPSGAEALVRWHHPQHGLMEPERFIPLAEESGLIDPIGEWILNAACAEATRWPAHVRIAVNLSPAQFRKGDLVDIITGALNRSGLAADRLELEVTESILLQKSEANLATLHAIKRLGVSIVLDDFGTGYSSLSYLRLFPFDKIKIEKSFIQELATRSDCAAIVGAIAGLARSLDVVTTAEGVETIEQLLLVRSAGCNQVQGFLFSRPCLAGAIDWKPVRTLTLSLSA